MALPFTERNQEREEKHHHDLICNNEGIAISPVPLKLIALIILITHLFKCNLLFYGISYTKKLQLYDCKIMSEIK